LQFPPLTCVIVSVSLWIENSGRSSEKRSQSKYRKMMIIMNRIAPQKGKNRPLLCIFCNVLFCATSKLQGSTHDTFVLPASVLEFDIRSRRNVPPDMMLRFGHV